MALETWGQESSCVEHWSAWVLGALGKLTPKNEFALRCAGSILCASVSGCWSEMLHNQPLVSSPVWCVGEHFPASLCSPEYLPNATPSFPYPNLRNKWLLSPAQCSLVH